MYLEVASELVEFRIELLDATIQIPNEAIVDDDVVNMHLWLTCIYG